MLGIKIDNEFLELSQGTQLELQQENPFLQFGDELVGDFSLPFEVKCSGKNLRLLDYSGLIQKRIDRAGKDASVYDNGLQHSIGKVKVEKSSIHLNHNDKTSISCYYLSATSNFWQDIKDARLRQANFGGTRSFPWDGLAFGTSGFWSHVTNVLNAPVNTYDYAFYPVINKSFDNGAGFTELLNRVKWVSASNRVEMETMATGGSKANPIVPFPYLHYVLRKAVEHVGWRIEGDIFSDPDFLSITMENFLAIDWGYFRRTHSGPIDYIFIQHTPIEFDLADHMPDISIADFLINLKKRLGWWYDFDRRNKTIRIRSLAGVAATEIKDYTSFSSPMVVKTVNKDQKIYALKNSFTGEYSNGQPDFSNIHYVGPVNNITALPTPDENNYGHVYLVRSENNYYICRQSETSPYPFVWSVYAYNVYDFVPEGANEEITTSATTIGNEFYNSYMDLVPRIDIGGVWPGITDIETEWNIILLFYRGLQPNKTGTLYPFASAGIYNSPGTQVGEWSLSFQCQKYDGTEVGLYDRQYQPVLALLSNPEQIEIILTISKADYLNLKFSDIISIKGVRFYVKTIKSTIPYRGTVTVEGVRI